jgi:hypothetical protein
MRALGARRKVVPRIEIEARITPAAATMPEGIASSRLEAQPLRERIPPR